MKYFGCRGKELFYFHFSLPSAGCRFIEELKCSIKHHENGLTMVTLSKGIGSCKNPWNGRCQNSDIEVYIYYKNKRVPICRKCWSTIAEKDTEW